MRTIACDKCGKIIRMVRCGQVIKDGPIGDVKIRTVDNDNKIIEEVPSEIDMMEFCPDCINKLIESFVKQGIAEQPDPSEMEKKAPEDPEPDADQREGTGDEAPATPADPSEEPAAGDGFKPVEVKLDPPKSSVRMITPYTRGQIRELAREGKSAREIAEITGVSVPTANKYMKSEVKK